MSNYEERTCDNCVYKKSMYCPNSFECYVKKDKPHFMSRATLIAENAMLLTENKQLQTKKAKLLKELVRAEAINEFADKVIAEMNKEPWKYAQTGAVLIISNLAKELTEEER